MCKVEANTHAAEIICEAKQAIENFKNGYGWYFCTRASRMTPDQFMPKAKSYV